MTAVTAWLPRPAPETVEMQLAQVFLHCRFCLLSIKHSTPTRTVMRQYLNDLTIKEGATGGHYAILSSESRLTNVMVFGLDSAAAP